MRLRVNEVYLPLNRNKLTNIRISCHTFGFTERQKHFFLKGIIDFSCVMNFKTINKELDYFAVYIFQHGITELG